MLELENKITEIKNFYNELISLVDRVQEKISKTEEWSTGIIQIECKEETVRKKAGYFKAVRQYQAFKNMCNTSSE